MTAFNEISRLLEKYFDVLYFCDVDKMSGVFHPQAIYATADEAPFLYRDMETYAEIIAQRQSPASRSEPRHDVIDAIEFAGSNTARATVRCSIGSRNFVDFLTLVRVESEWKIIAKVFQIIETTATEQNITDKR